MERTLAGKTTHYLIYNGSKMLKIFIRTHAYISANNDIGTVGTSISQVIMYQA